MMVKAWSDKSERLHLPAQNVGLDTFPKLLSDEIAALLDLQDSADLEWLTAVLTNADLEYRRHRIEEKGCRLTRQDVKDLADDVQKGADKLVRAILRWEKHEPGLMGVLITLLAKDIRPEWVGRDIRAIDTKLSEGFDFLLMVRTVAAERRGREAVSNQRGPSAGEAFPCLVVHLAQIYEMGTGRAPGRTQSETSPFAKFVRLFLSYAEPQRTRTNVGKSVYKVLSRVGTDDPEHFRGAQMWPPPVTPPGA